MRRLYIKTSICRSKYWRTFQQHVVNKNNSSENFDFRIILPTLPICGPSSLIWVLVNWLLAKKLQIQLTIVLNSNILKVQSATTHSKVSPEYVILWIEYEQTWGGDWLFNMVFSTDFEGQWLFWEMSLLWKKLNILSHMAQAQSIFHVEY